MTEPDDLARARQELGEPDALFQISPSWFRTKLLVGLALIAGGVAGFALWGLVGWRAFHVFAHFVLWPLGTGVVLLVNLYRQRGLFVLIYPTGLLRLRQGEVESFPWDEVAEVRLKTQKVETVVLVRGPDGVPVGCWLPAEVPSVQVWTAGLTVVRADGATVHFSPVLAGYAELAEEVQRRSFPPLWKVTIARFNDGRMLPFGKLEVSLLGIHFAGKLLPWSEVGKLTVAQGGLTVSQRRKWLPFAVAKPAAEVPNLHILFALAAYAVGEQPGAEPDPDPES